VWLGAIGVPDSAPVTIVLNDQGKKASDREVSDRVNRGEKVLAVDLLFTGDAVPAKGETSDYTQMLAATGDRPLGMEAAQLIAIAHWLKDAGTAKQVRIQSAGIRNQLVAQVAAALEPGIFTEILVRDGMKSLRHLLDTPVEYEAGPDLFCLDLYKQFDIDSLRSLAEATNVRMIASR
jgi:hypothetical protein